MTETAPSRRRCRSHAGSSGTDRGVDDRVGTLKGRSRTGLATIAVLPSLVSFHLPGGPDRPRPRARGLLTGVLGLIPGMMGQYSRRAFLAQVSE